MPILMGGLDVVGDDDEGMEDSMVLGAAPSRGGGLASRFVRRGLTRVPTPRWMRSATSQGVSRPQEELDFLPFDPVIVPVDALFGTPSYLLARPQRPFRAERLVMAASIGGTDVSFNVVIDPAMYVGAVQVGASQGAVPISAFSAQAFGVRLSMPSAGQGTDIKIFVRLLAANPETPTVITAVLIGRAMR